MKDFISSFIDFNEFFFQRRYKENKIIDFTTEKFHFRYFMRANKCDKVPSYYQHADIYYKGTSFHIECYIGIFNEINCNYKVSYSYKGGYRRIFGYSSKEELIELFQNSNFIHSKAFAKFDWNNFFSEIKLQLI